MPILNNSKMLVIVAARRLPTVHHSLHPSNFLRAELIVLALTRRCVLPIDE